MAQVTCITTVSKPILCVIASFYYSKTDNKAENFTALNDPENSKLIWLTQLTPTIFLNPFTGVEYELLTSIKTLEDKQYVIGYDLSASNQIIQKEESKNFYLSFMLALSKYLDQSLFELAQSQKSDSITKVLKIR